MLSRTRSQSRRLHSNDTTPRWRRGVDDCRQIGAPTYTQTHTFGIKENRSDCWVASCVYGFFSRPTSRVAYMLARIHWISHTYATQSLSHSLSPHCDCNVVVVVRHATADQPGWGGCTQPFTTPNAKQKHRPHSESHRVHPDVANSCQFAPHVVHRITAEIVRAAGNDSSNQTRISCDCPLSQRMLRCALRFGLWFAICVYIFMLRTQCDTRGQQFRCVLRTTTTSTQKTTAAWLSATDKPDIVRSRNFVIE